MYNIISQNLKNVLKNKIKTLITPILYNSVDFIVDNLFDNNAQNKYFLCYLTFNLQLENLLEILLLQPLKNLMKTLKILLIENPIIILINLMFLEL